MATPGGTRLQAERFLRRALPLLDDHTATIVRAAIRGIEEPDFAGWIAGALDKALDPVATTLAGEWRVLRSAVDAGIGDWHNAGRMTDEFATYVAKTFCDGLAHQCPRLHKAATVRKAARVARVTNALHARITPISPGRVPRLRPADVESLTMAAGRAAGVPPRWCKDAFASKRIARVQRAKRKKRAASRLKA